MKGGNISDDAIEQITMATIQAFEKLKELQTDLKQKTRKINSLQVNVLATQNNAMETHKKYQEAEKKLNVENEILREKIKELEYSNELMRSRADTFAVQLANERNKPSPNDQLAKKCFQLELEIKVKDELLVKQQLEIDLKNVECLKFKKMSKKYNKTLNTVSPQTVNNIQFVKKFPILESRCSSLIEKLEQIEQERDMLLSKMAPKRANSCSGSSYKDKLARRDAVMIDQLSSSNQARNQIPHSVARSAPYIPSTQHPLSTYNYQPQKLSSTYTHPTSTHGFTSHVPPLNQGPVFLTQNTAIQTPGTVSLTHHPVITALSSVSSTHGPVPQTRSTIPITRSSASISHGSGVLTKPTHPLTNTSTTVTNASSPVTNTPTTTTNAPMLLTHMATTVTNTPMSLSNTPVIFADGPTPEPLKNPASTNDCDSTPSSTKDPLLPYASNRKRPLLNRLVRKTPEPRLLAPAPDKIILRDRISLAERKKQKMES